MSLRDLNPRTRRRLRLHAWLLTAWCVAVGFLVSWSLLRGFGLRSPAARYAIAAVAIYGLGLVVGTRIWLRWFTQAAARERALLGRSSAQEQAAHDAEVEAGRRRSGRWDWLDSLDFDFDLGDASVLLLIPALLVLLVVVLIGVGAFPVLLAEGMAALLAEVAVQFVFGALIARRVMRPRRHDEAMLTIVGKTWAIGILLVVVSASAGFALSYIDAGAASLGDLWR